MSRGYPYFDRSRLVRSPFDDMNLDCLDHRHDPFAYPRRAVDRGDDLPFAEPRRHRNNSGDDEDFFSTRPRASSGYDDDFYPRCRGPPPLISVTKPREEQHRYIPPGEGDFCLDSFAHLSETPPPCASRHRISSFESVFGDVPAPDRTYSNERLHRDPLGPPNPFAHGSARSFIPATYNEAFRPSRDPFGPGGFVYDAQFRRTAAQDRDSNLDDTERRRRDHYRRGIGEPWGVARYNDYEERRRYGL